MTLEEAIIHAESVANSKCDKCGEEHRQLAEWLKDYQRLLSVIEDIKAEISEQFETEFLEESTIGMNFGLRLALEIIDNIGKAESEEV